MLDTWKKETVTDVVNLILGAFLFISPWIFGLVADGGASWNAWLSGFVVAALAIAALVAFATWEEWLNLVVGLWVAASPWLVGFAGNPAATRLHLVVGLIIAALAAIRLWLTRYGAPRVTT